MPPKQYSWPEQLPGFLFVSCITIQNRPSTYIWCHRKNFRNDGRITDSVIRITEKLIPVLQCFSTTRTLAPECSLIWSYSGPRKNILLGRRCYSIGGQFRSLCLSSGLWIVAKWCKIGAYSVYRSQIGMWGWHFNWYHVRPPRSP